ncbi:hypothetical protein [Nonomuraea dietziae]|uniref:hypothetical protein n=1 Tax=Nonomuraea dietziae TaxID=65515 RepID=UPI0031D3E08E
MERELTCRGVGDEIGLHKSTMSPPLPGLLRESGVVSSRQEGRQKFMTLRRDDLDAPLPRAWPRLDPRRATLMLPIHAACPDLIDVSGQGRLRRPDRSARHRQDDRGVPLALARCGAARRGRRAQAAGRTGRAHRMDVGYTHQGRAPHGGQEGRGGRHDGRAPAAPPAR